MVKRQSLKPYPILANNQSRMKLCFSNDFKTFENKHLRMRAEPSVGDQLPMLGFSVCSGSVR